MRNLRCRSNARLINAILSITSVSLLGSAPAAAAINEPVPTQSGLTSGAPARDPSVTVFKGIPFAAPPVGDLRWRAPAPAVPWQGVRKADQFGSSCPQRSFGPMAKTDASANEDCLFLNVWTGATSAAERRPVFVWIYGGRFMGGSGSQPAYDGEGLARKGLMVVTFNYRVGALGFLATAELSRESGHNASGNYGLLDQIAALQWVRQNIAAFGGDPNRVTIAGQSAGAGSAIMLSNSPLAKGLFQRVIAQSGARVPTDPAIHNLATSWRSLQAAERQGTQFAEAHGARSLQELRALSWQQVLEGSNLNDDAAGNGYGGSPPPPMFRPVIDGWVVPFNYSQTWDKGLQNDVVFVTGNNRDESGASPQPHITLKDYLAMATRQYGALAAEYLKLYPASSDQQAGESSNAAARDSSRVSTYLFTEAWKKFAKHPVYTYYWDHAPPGPDHDKQGAYHGSEINYAFDNLYATQRPWTDEDRRIAEVMSSYWVNIAVKGDPNGKGLPTWSATSPDSRTVMELGDRFGVEPLADDKKFDFWKRLFATQVPW